MGDDGRYEAYWTGKHSRRTFLKAASAASGAVLLGGAGSLLAACAPSTASQIPTLSGPSGSQAPSTSETPGLSGPPSKPTGTLRVAIPGQPNFIDPSQALEITEGSILRNVYDGLVEWNDDYTDLAPALATAWQPNSDATQWTFTLRQGVTFHDGATFDSHAARKTVEYYKDKNWGLVFANIQQIDDSDPNVLKLTFSKSSPDLARNQTFVKMISPKLIDANAAAQQAVGTGPYKWVSWDKNVGVTVAANENYWGSPPHLETIQFLSVVDNTAAITALQAGDLDLVLKVPPRQVQALALDKNLAMSTNDSWVAANIIIRCDQPITTDVRVRQAIAYAIDTEAIVSGVLLNHATVSTTPMPPGTYGYHSAATKYAHDPVKARALLTQAGYPTGPTLKMSAAALIRVMGEEVSQAIVAQLNAAGFNVTLDIQEAGVYVGDAIGPNPVHQLFHVEYGWTNGGPFHFTLGDLLGHPQYKGSDLTNLVDQVSTTPDGAARLQLLAQLQDQYMVDVPEIPLYTLKLTDVFRKELHGYRNPRDGYWTRLGGAYLVG